MLIKRGTKREKSILRACVAVVISFCTLGMATDLVKNSIANAEDTVYTTNVTVNDTALGTIGYGNSCSGTTTTSYTGTITIGWDNPGVYNRLVLPDGNGVRACPNASAVFSGWRVNGIDIGFSSEHLALDNLDSDTDAKNSILANTSNTITAVFEALPVNEVTIDAGAGTASVAAGNDYTVSGDGSNSLTLTATGSNVTTDTITVTPPSGYELNATTPITTTNSKVTASNVSGNTLTLTITGSDAVTINYSAIYNVTIDAGTGTINVASGAGYTISNNDSSQVTILTAQTNITTGTITVTPPSGYELNTTTPITTTNGNVTAGSASGNSFTLTLNGADTASIQYSQLVPYTMTFAVDGDGAIVHDSWCNPNASSANGYTSSNVNPVVIYLNNTITACPDNGAEFLGWRLSGTGITTRTFPTDTKSVQQWMGGIDMYNYAFNSGSNHTATLTALFGTAVQGYAVNLNAGSGSASVSAAPNSEYTVSGNNSSSVTINVAQNGSASATVTVNPPSGYALNVNNPISTQGGHANASNVSSNSFTLTMSEAETVTINYTQLYESTIDAGAGLVSVAAANNNEYSVSGDGTHSATISTTRNSITTNTVTVTPPSGYALNPNNPIMVTSGTASAGNVNGNTFLLVLNSGAADVTVNYLPIHTSTINAGAGSVSVATNNNYSVSDNNTSLATITTLQDNLTINTVTVTPPSGYRLDTTNPITVSNGTATASNVNNNSFTLAITDDATIAINYVQTTTTYNFSTNDTTLGKLNIGSDCTGAATDTTSLSYTASGFNTNGDSIWACPESGNTFLRWELDNQPYSENAEIVYNVSNLSSDGGTHTLKAVFSAPASPSTINLTTNSSSLGLINIGGDCNGTLVANQQVIYSNGEFDTNGASIIACPIDDNVFVRWELDNVQTSNVAELQHNHGLSVNGGTHTLTAVFSPSSANGYTVNVRPSNDRLGSISIASGSDYTVSAGNSHDWDISTFSNATVTTNTVTVIPTADCDTNEGGELIDCVFVGFTSSNGNTTWTKGASDNEYILTLTGADSVTAEFRRETQYSFKSHDPGRGGYDLVDGSCSSANYTEGTDYASVIKSSIGPVLDFGGLTEIVACPKPGYVFKYWELDGVPISTNPALSYADGHIINDNLTHNIMADFIDENQANNYTVTIKPDETNHGSLSLAAGTDYHSSSSNGGVIVETINTTGTVTTGTLTVTPASDYEFDHFASENGNTTWTSVGQNQYEFTLTGYDVVIAYFRSTAVAVQYTIGPNMTSYGGVNTTQNSCGDETSRRDISTGLDVNDYLDIRAANLIACPNTNFAFDHWELDGVSISSSATLSKSAQQWPTTGSHVLRAIFVPYGSQQPTLPYTGSAAMLIIIGGGIGLIAIPSAFLIISERKERQKGGKT